MRRLKSKEAQAGFVQLGSGWVHWTQAFPRDARKLEESSRKRALELADLEHIREITLTQPIR